MELNPTVKKAINGGILVGSALQIAGVGYSAYKTITDGKLTLVTGLQHLLVLGVGVAAFKYSYDALQNGGETVTATETVTEE